MPYDPKPKEELAALLQLLRALESGSMTIHQNGNDVTRQEIAKLRPDIRFLESLSRETLKMIGNAPEVQEGEKRPKRE